MDKVNKCLDDVERKMTKLNAITAKGASNINIKDAIKAARKGNSITATIKKGAKEFSALSPSEEELKGIIVKMDRLITQQEKQLAFTIQNKPHFDKIHISGTVRKSMQKSDGTSLELTKILVEKCPPSLKPEAEAIEKRARDSFDACYQAYSDAKGGEDLVDDKVDDSD
ncbi:uncharacterized protein LY89DRAFT_736455 [Mollisia scopiformis]|uniref:Uncharacterized protein n=1 Tax=Mollisia scopiformis TaxID=149040 RepID=A0A194X2K1_MOLSC|nr:uncharacterized protein LY89DRAFT_736455 [Mollisia scopiformis]KUJ14416.1 hypothetical protein LY89DRAFT_736455 [Mollisia scopiformis]